MQTGRPTLQINQGLSARHDVQPAITSSEQEQQNPMKLRTLDNSIRLRLTRAEVELAATDGIVKSSVSFPENAALVYILESSPANVSTSAFFSGGELTVRLPESDVREWASSERVSIAAEQILENGQVLHILVEKDFACLAPREGEDASEMFPNPLAGKETC
jgi:hypothetical protein